jgi:small GTP-binding protein
VGVPLQAEKENFKNFPFVQRIKAIELNGSRVKLQLWDTAGHERFRTITSSFYRGAQGVILVYDVINPHYSFEGIRAWMHDIDRSTVTENLPKLLVGNKSDLEEQRIIQIEQGQDLADSHGMDFI